MGYRGLLLNDPYKIDRMMGCVCGLISFISFIARRVAPRGGLRELKVKRGYSGNMGGFRGYKGFLGYNPSFRHFRVCGWFEGISSYSPKKNIIGMRLCNTNEHHPHQSILSLLSILSPIRGGAIIGVFMM
jgi:hypothetical protein